MIRQIVFAMIALLTHAFLEFEPGFKATISAEKFEEFKDVYFDFILESVLEEDWSYVPLSGNMGFMKDNTFLLKARGDEAVFTLD